MADRAGRPLSPHLQIFRWYYTMASSILHRITGVGLALGLLLLTWWLTALARGPESFAIVQAATGNLFGGLILFGFTFALFYHLVNGIRHLAWDAGYGFGRETAERMSLVVIGTSFALTLLTWIIVLAVA